MRTEEPRTIRLTDYTPPAWRIESVDLDFDLHPAATRVRATLVIAAQGPGPHDSITLNGESLKRIAIAIDGEAVPESLLSETPETLTIQGVPQRFTLTTEVEINPEGNTQLSGLYMSNGFFCTQCEAEGFRRITYYLDRPDVMAPFRVRMSADKAAFPVLLSNGNPGETGDLPGGRHFAVWTDPHKKPCYLFALVAGNLSPVRDSFTTMSGKAVPLAIWVEHGQEDKCLHAMDSLKRSMAWDEERFGREYDLDVFNIVAVSAFNFGAMENKGLNIFNDKLVFARADTATDLDFELIEAVVAHEYFHNWTGNRITCRDWFQLCLKEGLTVFRDQEFSADMGSRAVKRIHDVKMLRLRQFAEDGGPLAHPVRPSSYQTIDNFYTATVYEKGAELCRMIQTLLGAETFRRGMDIYFAKNDGTAATVEDFLAAFEEASGHDLSRFARWYHQAGTPQVTARGRWDAASGRYTLQVSQTTAPTPGQPEKAPFVIPLTIGFVGPHGEALPVALEGEDAAASTSRVIALTDASQSFTFTGLAAQPVPSIGRGFSAPIRLDVELSPEDRAHLMAHDPDPFNRWEAGQQYATALILQAVDPKRANTPERRDDFTAAWGRILGDATIDPAFKALALTLPSTLELMQAVEGAEPDRIHAAREDLLRHLAGTHAAQLRTLHDALDSREPYAPTPAQTGRRALRNTALRTLASLGTADIAGLAGLHYRTATNMTDMAAALAVLADLESPETEAAFADFYERYKSEPLVIDKWMSLQAMSARPDVVGRLRTLMEHPAFAITVPNRVRSLVGAFAFNNPLRFHGSSGEGYAFVAETVRKLDAINPQVAARILGSFESWRRLDAGRQALMRLELERIRDLDGVSRNTFEIASKALGDAGH